jgi:hypothetical protein
MTTIEIIVKTIEPELDYAFTEIVNENPVFAARLIVIRELLKSAHDDELWNYNVEWLLKKPS